MDICVAGLATSTRSQYGSQLQMFKLFCNEQGIYDYLHTNIATAIEFLTRMFKEGKSYSTINSARSALSHHIVLSDCKPETDFGKHPLTTKFMKGVFKLRPAVPKYNNIWDVKIVLDLLRNWVNTDITMKKLTLKCVTLLALTSGQRVQTLSVLSLENIQVYSNKIVFVIDTVLKTSKPGTKNVVEIFRFVDDCTICPMLCLQFYINRTKVLRDATCKSVFCSFVKPYKAVSSQSISRWICEVLREAKVPNCFTAHSTRSASTSKAAKHLDINCILQTVGWRSEVTFGKFYHKIITEEEGCFSKVVLK